MNTCWSAVFYYAENQLQKSNTKIPGNELSELPQIYVKHYKKLPEVHTKI